MSNPLAEISRPLSASRIQEILEYVAPGEIRVLAAEGDANAVLASVGFRSVQYTRNPVEYLSLAELAVVLAQTAQVLVDLYIESHAPELRDALAVARREHRVYFGRFDMTFHKKHPAKDYVVSLRLSRVMSQRGSWFGQIEFSVSDYVSGTFFGIVEHLGARL